MRKSCEGGGECRKLLIIIESLPTLPFRRVNKMTMIAEGAEAKRKEDEIAARKRKAEDQQKWEGAFSCSSSCRESNFHRGCLFVVQKPERKECRTGGAFRVGEGGRRRRRSRCWDEGKVRMR